MEKRKHIAVIIFDIHEQYQANMLKGILEQSFFLDTDVSVFIMIPHFSVERKIYLKLLIII